MPNSRGGATDFYAHMVNYQSSMFAPPVVPRIRQQLFPIARCLFPIALTVVFDCPVTFLIALVVVSDCSVGFSDCSCSRFPLLTVPFSDCSGTRFRLLSKLYYMLIHLNLHNYTVVKSIIF